MSDELVAGIHFPGPPAAESRFTWPTKRCPHPERWTSTDGDSTEIEVTALMAALVVALQPNYCVETGTAFAQTTVAMGRALAANGLGRLASLENDPERIVAARERCDGLPVDIIEVDSMVWMSDQVIDLALFDSFYELRVPEFRRYRLWMRPGTIVAFHDSAPDHGAHRIASGRDLATEIEVELAGDINFIHLPTPRGLTLGQVR